MPFVNGLVVLLYVGDPCWLLIPCAAGAWVGTYISMRLDDLGAWWRGWWGELS